MHAHLIQMDITWEDREANHAHLERLLDHADISPGDLVVLPEMFDVGFSINIDKTRDKDGATLRFLLRLADDLGVTIQGSRAVRDCDCSHGENRATVVGPSESETTLLCDYAKIHPFGYGRETEAFVGGSEVKTYAWGGITVCPAVCYDLRFPELFRAGAAAGAECFVIGANWPMARQSHWRALLVARAIENQAFVFGVNRVGNDPFIQYAGGSIALGPKGEVLAEAGADERILTVPVDPDSVRAWRKEFPALADRRL
ncbi:MAG: nitrilase-related carbon-nitrogen hydrolase [Planctomycetota bacterium]